MLTLYTTLQTSFDQLACALLYKPDQQDSVGFWQRQALAPDWPLFGYRGSVISWVEPLPWLKLFP